MRPFSIRIFSPSGTPDGVLVATNDNWPGRAVIYPRDLAGEVKGRKEYLQPGVYILVGPKRMYIGEGDPVGDRLDTHARNKAFWNKAVFFTAEGGRLNKAHVQHLESRLIALAKDTGRVTLENGNQPTVPALSEEDYAFAENFLHECLLMLPLLGFQQFVPVGTEGDDTGEDADGSVAGETISSSQGKRAELYKSLPSGLEFRLTTSLGADCTLVIGDGGVIIKKGSRVADPVKDRFEIDAPSYAALRRQLLESGVIAPSENGLVFTRDQFFSSGSAAATVARGINSNADWWKGPDGRSLGDLLRAAKQAT